MSVDVLKDDLKNNKIRKLYLFYGEEEYLKKYYLGSIEKQIIDEGTMELNRILLDGKVDPGKIIDACETMPVFADKKLVIVKNSGVFKSGKKGAEGNKKGKKQTEELPDYLGKLPDYVCLVFYEDEIDKRLKTVDVVKKNGLMVEFPFQKPPELVKWVIKVLKSQGKDIDQMAASVIVDNSEQGMNDIMGEVNKLALFAGDRLRITVKDVKTACTKTIKGRIFDLTDAIVEKDTTRSLKLLNDMIALKEPLLKIMFMISKQFRQILEMKLLKANGLGSNEAASKMALSPYAAGKISKFSGAFSEKKLKEIIEESLKLDVEIKTGKVNDRVAAELLIAKIAED